MEHGGGIPCHRKPGKRNRREAGKASNQGNWSWSSHLFHHGDEPGLLPLLLGSGDRPGVAGGAVSAVHVVIDALHRIRVEQALVRGAPVYSRCRASHVADLLEQLLRGGEEPGPSEHRRVAGEGPERARGRGGERPPRLRGRRVR